MMSIRTCYICSNNQKYSIVLSIQDIGYLAVCTWHWQFAVVHVYGISIFTESLIMFDNLEDKLKNISSVWRLNWWSTDLPWILRYDCSLKLFIPRSFQGDQYHSSFNNKRYQMEVIIFLNIMYIPDAGTLQNFHRHW